MPSESGNVFDPRSTLALSISNAFVIVLVLGLGVFALVSFLVIYGMVKYRRRAGDNTEPPQVSGNQRIEVAWTVGPILLASALMVMTFFTMGASDPPKDSPNQQPDLEIIGHQWWWEYRYPKDGVITADELHIPAGKRLYARFASGDVLHQWWVPALGRMMNSNVEHINYTWVQADQPGQYIGACAQFCGGPHAWMLIKVVAQPQAQFDAWLQQQKQASPGATASGAAPAGSQGDPAKGAQVFLQNTCVNCHTVAGTAANAQVGPSLSHFGSRSIIGSGVLNNTPENLKKWVRNPQNIKPGVLMPGYNLSDDDLNNLVAYLEGLK